MLVIAHQIRTNDTAKHFLELFSRWLTADLQCCQHTNVRIVLAELTLQRLSLHFPSLPKALRASARPCQTLPQQPRQQPCLIVRLQTEVLKNAKKARRIQVALNIFDLLTIAVTGL